MGIGPRSVVAHVEWRVGSTGLRLRVTVSACMYVRSTLLKASGSHSLASSLCELVSCCCRVQRLSSRIRFISSTCMNLNLCVTVKV